MAEARPRRARAGFGRVAAPTGRAHRRHREGLRLILGPSRRPRRPEIPTRRHGNGDSAVACRHRRLPARLDDHPGDGVPVVLLHGGRGDRRLPGRGAPARRAPGARARLRGFGDTTNPADADATAYGVDGQAAEVIALVEAAVGGPWCRRLRRRSRTARPSPRPGPTSCAAWSSRRRARGGPPGPRPRPAARVLVQAFHGSRSPSACSTATARPSTPTSNTSGRTVSAPTTRPSPPSSTASPTPTPAGRVVRSVDLVRQARPRWPGRSRRRTPTRPTGSPRRPRSYGQHDPLFSRDWSTRSTMVRRRRPALRRRHRPLRPTGGPRGGHRGAPRA